MALRPNGFNSDTVPLTQFFHEWVHELDSRGHDIADGSRGKPSFPKDKDAENAILELYRTVGDVFPYCSNSLGEKKYREQAARGFSKEYGCKFDADDMVFTPGGQFGIAAAFQLVESIFPGSAIVSGEPWYVNHNAIANMFSGTGFYSIPRFFDKFFNINLLENGVSRLTANHIRYSIAECKKQSRKIGAFLFCNPMNPLGQVTRKEEWKEIAEALDEYPDALILMDEAFAEVVFDQNFNISILHAAPHLKDRMILFRSGTKTMGFPGERLAVMAVPKKHLDILTAFQSRLLGGAPLSVQAGMAAGMETMSVEKKKKISEYYYGNYKLLRDGLAKKGIKPVAESEGGFYVLMDFSKYKGAKIPAEAAKILDTSKTEISTDFDLSISLMTGLLGKNRGIASIPASAFGASSRNMILRVSYSTYKEEINKFIEFLG